MKRLYIFLITVAFHSAMAMAADVTPQAAARFAGLFLNTDRLQQVQDAGSSGRSGTRGGQSQPAYYVYNNPEGGWVIIAADDRVCPVIAYSDEGSFKTEGMPENLGSWMDGIAEAVESVRNSGLQASDRIREMWNSPVRSTQPGTSKTIETALWDQGTPYNDYCPVIPGEREHALTGCVATAAAIVMRYYRWPEKGKGVIGGYYSDTDMPAYIPSYSIDDHTYNWDEMPLTDGYLKKSAWTDRQKAEVAQLMHDCGVMFNMGYSASSSSAYSEDIVGGITSHMSYSASTKQIFRSSYTPDEWFSIIKNEIDADRLVLYDGQGDYGGHQFVCDGYDTDGNKLHINWGWGGLCNGFFTLDMNVNDDVSFQQVQSAIVGIMPDSQQGESEYPDVVVLEYFGGFYGLTPDTDFLSLKRGTEVRFIVGWLVNPQPHPLTVSLRIRLTDINGNVRQYLCDNSEEGELPGFKGYVYSWNGTDTLDVDVNITDRYILQIKCGDGEWQDMKPDYTLYDAQYVSCGALPEPVINIPSDCHAGDKVDLRLLPGYMPLKSVRWFVNDVEIADDIPVCTLQSGRNEIRAEAVFADTSEGTVRTVVICD